MIYTEMTKRAIRFAFPAHEGQQDRAGLPYVLHPVHLAEQMTDEDTCVVALLHDVLEDTEATVEDLRNEGFTEVQIRAVQLLTREKDGDYLEYVRNLKNDPIARTVKMKDLEHNLDHTRLDEVTERDEIRFRRYRDAVKLLADG